MGFKDTGLILSVLGKAGGYYMGMSQTKKEKSKFMAY